ncbi:MAG: AtpZ/AtpI family protein [Planctomycetota bacterium]|jgi:F0F1-type ATP synthase assembly protein I|nr:AtpZ/AtpI family protein [Planctomycetota bacterium]MDP6987884.1 AtpZ/AtpI family protein [Planctomycetota bacterium]
MNHDHGRYAGLGLTYAGTIVVMGALGYAIDQALGSLPWGMIAGIALGAVGGFLSLLNKVPGAAPRPPHDHTPPDA